MSEKILNGYEEFPNTTRSASSDSASSFSSYGGRVYSYLSSCSDALASYVEGCFNSIAKAVAGFFGSKAL
jgi:hypothetical protein